MYPKYNGKRYCVGKKINYSNIVRNVLGMCQEYFTWKKHSFFINSRQGIIKPVSEKTVIKQAIDILGAFGSVCPKSDSDSSIGQDFVEAQTNIKHIDDIIPVFAKIDQDNMESDQSDKGRRFISSTPVNPALFQKLFSVYKPSREQAKCFLGYAARMANRGDAVGATAYFFIKWYDMWLFFVERGIKPDNPRPFLDLKKQIEDVCDSAQTKE
ncbi:hypothetical protein FACS189449_12310 [Alphaproteobacteria bacterium]|nr:hypothetical protein FACS189449_12310 [Alphaproteobacteria bacterium]